LSIVLTLALATACGDDEKPPRNREQFCNAWAEAACSPDVVSYCQAADAEACIDSQDEFCHDLVPDDFADSNGDACIEAVAKAYKDGNLNEDELAVVLRLGEPCNELIVGPAEEGERCQELNDCDTSSGLQCILKSDSDDGVCEIPEVVGGGEDCEADQKTCMPGFYCNGENCLAAKAVGRTCTIQAECDEDGFCDEGMCVERLPVGSACNADHECSAGLCYEGECTSNIRLGRSELLCDSLR
jgi:hypothetical protein